MLFMGLLNFVFLICSIKTDIVHVIIFATLVIAFGLLTGEYFYHAMGPQYVDTYSQLAVVSFPSGSAVLPC
jgi:succinate-acetate transporter protein